MKKLTRALLLYGLILLFYSCTSQNLLKDQNVNESPLMVKVFNGQNRSLPNVLIELLDSNENTYSAVSDITGKALFPPIKYGEYLISFSGEELENLQFNFSFTQPEQTVYSRLFSISELLSEAEESLEKGEWTKAEDFINRAEITGANIKEITWYQAVLNWNRGDIEKSLEFLLRIPEMEGRTAPEVYMLLADIYQYEMMEPEKVIEYLELSLKVKEDRSVRIRLQELKGELDE